MKRLTKKIKDKIVADIVNLLKGMWCYDHIAIYWNGKRQAVDECRVDFDDNDELIATYVNETLSETDENGKPWKASSFDEYADDSLITLAYECSRLYNALNYGEYDPVQDCYTWSTRDEFEKGIAKILKPYDLRTELHYSWCLGIHEA